ncbi:Uncharacterised protein [Vibrio cholerae]|nr:Uncharacterised protein [Vibrio cholerae]
MGWDQLAICTFGLFGIPFNKTGGVVNFSSGFCQRFTLFNS